MEPADNPTDLLHYTRTSPVVLVLLIKVLTMHFEKKWHYLCLIISFLIVPALYLNLNMVVYWFYSIPKELSLIILWVAIPVGTYVSIKNILLSMKYIFRKDNHIQEDKRQM